MSPRCPLNHCGQLFALFSQRAEGEKNSFQRLVALYLTSVCSHPIDSSLLSVLMSLDISDSGSLNTITRGIDARLLFHFPPFFPSFLAKPSHCWKLLNICYCFPFETLHAGGGGIFLRLLHHLCLSIATTVSTPDVPYLPSKSPRRGAQ